MISANSRYGFTKLVIARNLDDTSDIQVMTPSLGAAHTFQTSFYYWKQFDTLPNLANDKYGDPTLWWIIADANPQIMLWDTLPVGTIIRTPESAL